MNVEGGFGDFAGGIGHGDGDGNIRGRAGLSPDCWEVSTGDKVGVPGFQEQAEAACLLRIVIEPVVGSPPRGAF